MQRRRIKVIDNVFQYRLIAVLLLIVVGALAVFAAGALLVSAAVHARDTASIFPPVLVNDVVIMLAVVVAGIFLTHRIAGPVHRIQSDIQRVLAGEKGVRVRLRKHDAFPELAEKVNRLIERIDGTPQR